MSDSLVIIPTYKEEENIKSIIVAIFSLPRDFDVLVIDDNSPDQTAQIVKELMQAFPNKLQIIQRPGKLGLGTAYIAGFKYALLHEYEYIFEMDADFSHNPKDLMLLYQACAKDGYEMAIGSRYASGVNVVNWPMSRVLLSYFASIYVQWVTGMPIKDSTAGFVCYTKKVLQTINLNKVKFVGYAFQIEMKFTTWKFGFRIKEVPIIFTNRILGESKMSTGIFSEAVFGIIRMKIRSYFKSYKHI
ncbi:MAG: polyprenol monophosphomannose synthase [Cyclobacteriaceae bacterium]|nr:polyprenol monophosphomannose synthase [Cyclobacteriaceae bacterium]